jgi:tetratricopeptide (TPR) repeat protein
MRNSILFFRDLSNREPNRVLMDYLFHRYSGELALCTDHLGDALDHFEKTQKRIHELPIMPEKNGIQADLNLMKGIALLRKGRLEDAKRNLERVRLTAVERGDLNLELKACHELGIIAIEQRRTSEASTFLEKALHNSRKTGNLFGEADALFELALISLKYRIDFAKAKELYSNALRISISLKSQTRVNSCTFGLADLLYESSLAEGADKALLQTRAAEEEFTKCIHHTEHTGQVELMGLAYDRRARCRALRRDYEGARSDFEALSKLATIYGIPSLNIARQTLKRIMWGLQFF